MDSLKKKKEDLPDSWAAWPITAPLKVEPVLGETERVILKDFPDRYTDEDTPLHR